MTFDNHQIFDSKRQLDKGQVDKAIRSLYDMMDGVQRREAWPVGSIFITVTNDNPAELLGYGTWVLFGQGRMIIGVSNEFSPAERTG